MANSFTDANGKVSVTAEYVGSDGKVSKTVKSEDKQMSITIQLPNEDSSRLAVDVDEDGHVDIYLDGEPEHPEACAFKAGENPANYVSRSLLNQPRQSGWDMLDN